ncbi:Wilms tumor protein 1-interacting protein isoform X1 [Parasteatoda tepidariorum]|uniref:Wilms tumor protein 1-interacting protein isoform X1 n=1 Tax=Parasteatoda tepidariorum TaxID=114398 RepID=UPI001C729582|nr:Wilms tumor protein 1-interacting protein-like isoform X1 [Parasteatoda tepidariorum]XP_042906917.1 Wilms tumor protein 1-interacting protein-like isoform X1 [Parasteatoda tepidariorum]
MATGQSYLGTCAKCLGVISEKGCTAEKLNYHQRCFVCSLCCKELYGKPYYTMNGKPYCEEDYLNKLDKCASCNRPILEKILKAEGHKFHPECFKCSACKKCLDGVPFSVDPDSKNVLCMDDYKKKVAPQCARCKKPIAPPSYSNEVTRVLAMGNSYHTTCYRCEDCGLPLSSNSNGRGCYPLNDNNLDHCYWMRKSKYWGFMRKIFTFWL